MKISHSERNIYRSNTGINQSQRGIGVGEEDSKLVIIEPGLRLKTIRNIYIFIYI
jgi:hypothetical protein